MTSASHRGRIPLLVSLPHDGSDIPGLARADDAEAGSRRTPIGTCRGSTRSRARTGRVDAGSALVARRHRPQPRRGRHQPVPGQNHHRPGAAGALRWLEPVYLPGMEPDAGGWPPASRATGGPTTRPCAVSWTGCARRMGACCCGKTIPSAAAKPAVPVRRPPADLNLGTASGASCARAAGAGDAGRGRAGPANRVRLGGERTLQGAATSPATTAIPPTASTRCSWNSASTYMTRVSLRVRRSRGNALCSPARNHAGGRAGGMKKAADGRLFQGCCATCRYFGAGSMYAAEEGLDAVVQSSVMFFHWKTRGPSPAPRKVSAGLRRRRGAPRPSRGTGSIPTFESDLPCTSITGS